MVLKDILYKTSIEAVKGSTDVVVNKIEFDSRLIGKGDAFVAIRGTQSDGHDYIEKAIKLGAVVIVCEWVPEIIIDGITYIEVKSTSAALVLLTSI